MKTTALFLILLSFISYAYTQKVFDQVKSLLVNFKEHIQSEEISATNRCLSEDKWVKNQINLAIAKLAHRTKDVNDVKAHIKFLENEIKETLLAIKSRQDRIAANLRLLKQFKKERCENNLLFVKSLREHIEGIEIMTLLRIEIIKYFREKSKKSVSFLEKFEEFSHLLDEEHKLILSQLTTKMNQLPTDITQMDARTQQYSQTRARTSAQVGTGQVDNTRGELKKLVTPGFETMSLFLTKLEKKVLFMIDSLILHLQNSRDSLTKGEIKSSEDFAIFQKNMFKENIYLRAKIVSLNAHLVSLRAQLNASNQQLVKREKLRKEAEAQLAAFRKMKSEKDAYCKKESLRRANEINNVNQAQSIFLNVLNKLSLRVKLRAQSGVEGKGYGKGQTYDKAVRNAQRSSDEGIASRLKSREEVAY